MTREGVPVAALTEEERAKVAEEEEAKRKKDSHYLAAESIKRELAESASISPFALGLREVVWHGFLTRVSASVRPIQRKPPTSYQTSTIQTTPQRKLLKPGVCESSPD